MAVKIRQRKGKSGVWVMVDHDGRRAARRFDTEGQAQLAAIKMQEKLLLGHADALDRTALPPRPMAPTVVTFADYAERWLTRRAALGLRESSVEQYTTRLRVHLLPGLGVCPIQSITGGQILDLLAAAVRDGPRNGRPGRRLAKGSVTGLLATLGTIFSSAESDGLILRNPCARLGKQLRDVGAREAATVDVFAATALATILDTAERAAPDVAPLILLLARTGLRFGEAAALQWSDVDLEARSLRVARSLRQGRVTAPKSHKARSVDLSPGLVARLRAVREQQDLDAMVAGTAAPERPFSDPRGRAWEGGTFRPVVWYPLLRRAGVRPLKPHALRHTYASLLLAARENLLYVSQQLGHSSPAFTLKVYGHLMPKDGAARGVDVLDTIGSAGVPDLAGRTQGR